MPKEKLIPELRFPEFKGEWVEKNLASITSKIGSGKTPLGGENVYTNSGIPFIRSQNVLIDRLNLDSTHIPIDVHIEMQGSKVLPNDILLNITGGSIGRSCVVPISFTEGNVNQHVCIIRLKQDNPWFLQPILSSSRGQKLIFQTQTGSGREGLNFESIKGFKIFFPQPSEQQKIAIFLTSVDKRITLLTQKKEKLEQYKKGVMQKIFNREIRFKDENGREFPEWEEKRLGEITIIFSGGTPQSTNKLFYDGDIPFIKSGELNLLKTEQNITQKGLESSSAKLVKKGDLLLAIYGATSGEVAICKINGAINQAILCIRGEFDNVFLYNWFKLNKMRIISTYLQGGQGNLSAEIIKDLKITLPKIQEQQKIATFLSALDKQIEAVGKQAEAMKEWKKGLLQKMFV
jgi:type I restriction enzyme, S subunit